MKTISQTLQAAFDAHLARNWDHIYILVDVHGVMMKPDYGGVSSEIYPDCIAPLQTLTKDKRVKLIMWTCSRADHILKYRQMMINHEVKFDYVNENPEVDHLEASGDYSVKLYANVIMDDKGGFEPHIDWKILQEYLTSDQYIRQCTAIHSSTLESSHSSEASLAT